MAQDIVAAFDDAHVQAMRQLLQDRVDQKSAPSVFATLFHGGDVLWEWGVGERKLGGESPDAATVYRIASCSKSFTVVMLLILRERGLVHLDAPVTDFVPEFTQSLGARAYDPPTLRMLASMSGGLPTDDPWADRQESISNETLRTLVARGVPLTSAPGTRFQYSNLGFALLGQVIEEVSGRAFVDLVNEEILRPLNLDETGYVSEVVSPEQLAVGYRPGPDGWVELPFSPPGAFSSIGGLFASGRDLARWATWLGSALAPVPDDSGPLSVSARREMQQIVTAIPRGAQAATLARNAHRACGYGFGLFIEDDEHLGQFVSHSGGYPGFSAHMRWHVPTGLGVVVFENATYSGAARTATELLEQVLENASFEVAREEPWELTRDKAREASALLYGWDEALAERIFEENVNLDVPFAERRARWARLVDELGGLVPLANGVLNEERSETPLHVTWVIPAARGSLRCEIRLSPTTPSLIQTFNVSKG